MNKMRSRQDLIDLREACIKSMSAETKKILVCGGTGCVAGGALDIFARLKELMVERDIAVEVELADEPHGDVVGIKRSGCHGFCEMGPLVRIEPQGWLYTKVKVEDCEEIVEKTIAGGECVDRLAYRQNGEIYRRQEDIPFYAKQHRVVLEHCGHINALSIREYLAMGGYKALEKALFEMTSAEILDEVETSNLRGRGGGGSGLRGQRPACPLPPAGRTGTSARRCLGRLPDRGAAARGRRGCSGAPHDGGAAALFGFRARGGRAGGVLPGTSRRGGQTDHPVQPASAGGADARGRAGPARGGSGGGSGRQGNGAVCA